MSILDTIQHKLKKIFNSKHTESGNRGTCSRLYYSNDGLMFYTDHFKDKVYQII